MSNSASEKLAIVKNLINQFKLEEAFQHVENIEQRENLTQEETLKVLFCKGELYIFLGQFENAIQIQKAISFEIVF